MKSRSKFSFYYHIRNSTKIVKECKYITYIPIGKIRGTL